MNLDGYFLERKMESKICEWEKCKKRFYKTLEGAQNWNRRKFCDKLCAAAAREGRRVEPPKYVAELPAWKSVPGPGAARLWR